MITNLSEAAFHKVHKDYLDAAIEKLSFFKRESGDFLQSGDKEVANYCLLLYSCAPEDLSDCFDDLILCVLFKMMM